MRVVVLIGSYSHESSGWPRSLRLRAEGAARNRGKALHVRVVQITQHVLVGTRVADSCPLAVHPVAVRQGHRRKIRVRQAAVVLLPA